MVISCEHYEAPCIFSSVGSEHLVYTERVGGSNPSRCTVGAQRTHDLARDLFLQTQCLKLSCQSTGLALYPHGEMVNTTILNVVSCRFESYWGYKIKVAELVDAR